MVRNNELGVVDCDEENEDVYTFNNMWFKPTTDELKHDTVKGIPCPTDFCRKCESPICKFDIKNQCASGRDQESFLCSKCEKDKYLAYGSAKCSIIEKGW